MEPTPRFKKLVYVIGPFRAKSDYERMMNIRVAQDMTYKLWRMGYVAICAHVNTRDMEGLVDIEDILAGDMAILERCDFCVTTLPFDSTKMRDSVGTQKEIERCKKLKIPVYESLSVVKLNEE